MSEQLPPPGFDAQSYERPNQKWICGHAAEGQPCRIGPDVCGHCQATIECVPVLETKPGETKGRWRCTRPGGACETGPRPDGTCCRPIAKCSPVPTLRTRRGQLTRAVVAATFAGLLIALGGSWRGNFINPGELSTPHASAAFARQFAGTNKVESTCAACHAAGSLGPAGLVNAAGHTQPGPLQLAELLTVHRGDLTRLDASCQKCHPGHLLHQPDVVRDISCSFCHQEHQGRGPMPAPTDAHCALCHGDAAVMAAASRKGSDLPLTAFNGAGGFGRNVFPEPRPAAGFTRVITTFAGDHPEFRFRADGLADPDTLRFNHALHLTGKTIPRLPDGRKLDCAYCHQPDAAGTYFKRVNFENNCRVCHSLQFDPDTPELHLPHGSPQFVSAFLHSLPKQYLEVAARAGITGTAEQQQFAARKLEQLRQRMGPGEDLERRVFFSTASLGPTVAVGTVSGLTPALYPGCAYCHEVKPGAASAAVVTPPVLFDRWLRHAQFNHAQHAKLDCTQCHRATTSTATADILLPAKADCVNCHSPRGGVVDSCTTCHKYHKPEARL